MLKVMLDRARLRFLYFYYSLNVNPKKVETLVTSNLTNDRHLHIYYVIIINRNN